MDRSSHRLATLAGLAVVATTVAACSDDPDPDSRRGIDAQSYFQDYEEADEEDGGIVQYSAEDSGAAAEPTVQPDPGPAPPPDPDEDNTFRDHGTGGFADTAADPRSTFALDVDTGSYGVARTLLRDGYRVPPGVSSSTASRIRSVWRRRCGWRSGSTRSTTATPRPPTATSA
jgi:Ca-activated chloride channel family protein